MFWRSYLFGLLFSLVGLVLFSMAVFGLFGEGLWNVLVFPMPGIFAGIGMVKSGYLSTKVALLVLVSILIIAFFALDYEYISRGYSVFYIFEDTMLIMLPILLLIVGGPITLIGIYLGQLLGKKIFKFSGQDSNVIKNS